MTLAALTWLTLGACLIYLVTQDPNVYTWMVLLSKTAGIWVRRRWFLLRHNPDTPWVRYAINRNARRLARELTKELENK